MNWTISQLDRSLPDGVVLTAHWRVSKTQDGFTGTVYGTISFPAKDPADPDFIPYEDLTQDQVLGWCWENGVDKAATEAAVQTQIDNQINPPVVSSPLPWAA